MKMIHSLVFALLLFNFHASFASNLPKTVHHHLAVQINPETHEVQGTDQITFSEANTEFLFLVDQSMEIQLLSNATAQLTRSEQTFGETLQTWKISNFQNSQVTLKFQGTINHPVVQEDTPGHIGTEGVSLFPSSGWYPHFIDHLETFQIEVKMLNHWPTVINGKLVKENSDSSTFSELNPQEGIYLFSGPFNKTSKSSNGISLNIYLKNNQPELANQLLDSLVVSLDHYQSTIGQFPYTQFSVVENFWETGYGIPGITLLGPQVIQLPFLITSSLPHELLHNWWGNSVFVNLDHGNWCEGLTTYGADHWQQVLKSTDANYRRDALIQYKNFVSSSKEFPLVEFTSRHDSSSQAIGYGKSMMFYHMLRNLVGPVQFQKSLATFYQEFKFKEASWLEMQKSFEKSTGKNLKIFFDQWLTKTGAPRISIEKYQINNGVLSLSLSQNNKEGIIYNLLVPIKVNYKNSAENLNLNFTQSIQDFVIPLKEPAISIAIDSDFELFRQIYTDEVPVLFSAFFGEKYFNFYSADKNSNSIVDIFTQKFNSTATPTNNFEHGSVNLLIGSNEKIKNLLNIALADQGVVVNDQELNLDGQKFSFSENTMALSFRYNNITYFWFNSALNEDPVRSAQRFTHYTNQSLVVFKKDKSLFKKTWIPKKSPLIIYP